MFPFSTARRRPLPDQGQSLQAVQPRTDGPRLERMLRSIIRRGQVMVSAAHLAGYDSDGLAYKHFRPDAVVIPADCDELERLMRQAGELAVPLIIRGAGTSLSGGPVAAQGGVIVHTSSLRTIRQICPEGLWCEVECGVTLKQLEDALRPHGLFYPPDPSSGMVCTLGGNVAMNAGGAHCFRHGVTGHYVLGVEAILPDGSLHRFGGPAGACGHLRQDWKRLLVGSEGTLGALTRFWLRLLPIAEKAWTFRATYPDLRSAEAAIHALVVHPAYPVAIELMDPRFVALVESSPMAVGLPRDAFLLVTEIDGPAELVDSRVAAIARLLDQAGALDVAYSDDVITREKLWKARKVAGGLMGQMNADLVVQDAVIPKRALAETLELIYREADQAGIPVINVFHAGDGNLHPNFLFDSRCPVQWERVEQIGKRLMRWVVEVGGTLSGEHGIGNDKIDYMPLVFGPEAIRLQLSIPAIFNPRHQLNPLKVFSERRFESAMETATADGDTDGGGDTARDGARDGDTAASDVSADSARRFEPFFDPIDGVLCIAADVAPAGLWQAIGEQRFRLPLLFDATTPLDRQVAAASFAPASSRFGPWCDQIIGMNWRLPDGRVVRLGERVAKSTTGYDLLRFFLAGGKVFGEPTEFVLRLRPAEDTYGTFWLRGDGIAIDQASAALRRSDWIQWFDSCDIVIDQAADESLRIVANLPDGEWPIVESYLGRFASDHALELNREYGPQPPRDGLPDAMLKTTADTAADLARRLAVGSRRSASGATDRQTVTEFVSVRSVVSCVSGAIWLYLGGDGVFASGVSPGLVGAHESAGISEPAADRLEVWLTELEPELVDLGGEWQSRWIERPPADPLDGGVESTWLAAFSKAAGIRIASS